MSPTQKTLNLLRDEGWTADIVERRIRPRVTKDFLGIADIIAVKGNKTLAVQATNQGNHANHRRKLLASENLQKWCSRDRAIEIWSWHPKKPDPRIERLTPKGGRDERR